MGTSNAGRFALKPRHYPHYAIAIGMLCCVLAQSQNHAAASDFCVLTATALCGQLGGMNERRTADNLIRRARDLMNEGNLELAEWYVEKAEKLDVKFDGLWSRFADTPQKIRADLLKLKAKKKLADAAKQLQPPTPSQQFRPQPATAKAPAKAPSDSAAGPQGANGVNSKTTSAGATIDELTDDAKSRALRYLNLGREAIASGNTVAALGYYRSSLATGAEFDSNEFSPAQLAEALQKAGVDPARLQPVAEPETPPSAGGLDPAKLAIQDPQIPNLLNDQLRGNALAAKIGLDPANAIPSTSPSPERAQWEKKRNEAVKLLAESQLALDRGDLKSAEQLALKAQDLRIPDKAYQPRDKRPWMLLMEVGRRQNRILPVVEAPPLNRTASSDPQPPLSSATALSGVSPSVYDPINDATAVQLTAGEESAFPATAFPAPPSVPPPAAVPIPAAPQRDAPAAAIDDAELTGTLLSQAPAPSANSTPGEDFTSPAAEVTNPFVFQPDPPEILPQDPPARALPSVPALPAGSPPADPSPDEPSQANRLYQQGVAALKDHNSERAWRLFVEAWQLQDELDPDTRQELQGYLQSFASTADDRSENDDLPARALEQLDDEEQQALRRFVSEVTREQAAIRRLKETRPREAWEQLEKLRQKVAKSEVNEEARSRLLSRVDRSLNELETFIEQNRPTIELDERNRAMLADVERRRAQRLRNQQDLATFVDQFNTLMDQQRYHEAELIARKAREIDPLSPVVQNMLWKTQFARQMVTHMLRNERFQDRSERAIGDVLDSAEPFPDSLVQEFPNAKDWSEMTLKRKRFLQDTRKRYTEEELAIDQALKKKVDVQFNDEPLYAVLDNLAKLTGINIFLDPEGIDAHGIERETPVNLSLRKPVSLKSALNLILEPLELSYIIQDEVLRVTSEMVRDGDTVNVVYYVADLVVPIPNFSPSYNVGLPGAIREAHHTAASGLVGGVTNLAPLVVSPSANGLGDAPQNASVLAQMGQSGMLPIAGANSPSSPLGYGPGGPGGGSLADFDTLIELITTTVEPDTWEDLGGPGTLQGFPTNLSLVVSQTQEIHEKVADLLTQLRRLQDLQVTIEVRFITLNDDFFERIGIDFDFQVDDKTGLLASEVDRLIGNQGNFDDVPPHVTVGMVPGTLGNTFLPTADVDIKFNQGSFGATAPTFGGFDPNAAANVGFAILSDIEAFFVIEAAQGDSRSNVLQAPKVTLFNGQQAFISDTRQQPFVTSVIPVVGDFAAAHQPVITVLSEGTSLSVQAVVSNDRRFVRLTLVPFFSRIGDVDTFQFEGRTDSDSGSVALDPADGGSAVQNNVRTVNEGTTVQLPEFVFTTVNTTVSVPDGGTILLGGIKRLAEERNEQGVPMLSKLPYINRLFKNVGIGRETQSLMMMVTPRIIIQEEEEANVLGGISGS